MRITEDMYDKVSIQTQRERRIIDVRLKRLNTADETYYLSCKYLIKILEKAPEIFKSSEMDEKRELIGLALQNLQLDGKKLHYEARKSFSSILEFAKHSKWGG